MRTIDQVYFNNLILGFVHICFDFNCFLLLPKTAISLEGWSHVVQVQVRVGILEGHVADADFKTGCVLAS